MAASVGPALVGAEPSKDWRDYVDETEQPAPWCPEDEVWLWRRLRAHRRMRDAQRAHRAENGMVDR
ncbi:hypothetical protein ACIOFV_50255 [Streptomyces mirabilis]|uniref:hypothetical protein n=1 Tax=Streptomyces mirabilis TaxID=68239 RepID=UPI0038213434